MVSSGRAIGHVIRVPKTRVSDLHLSSVGIVRRGVGPCQDATPITSAENLDLVLFFSTKK